MLVLAGNLKPTRPFPNAFPTLGGKYNRNLTLVSKNLKLRLPSYGIDSMFKATTSIR